MSHHPVRGRVAALLAFAAIGSACRLSDLTTGAPGVPAVTVATNRVVDSAVVGARAPQRMPVVMTGPAGASLDWSARASTPAGWLTLDPPSGHTTLGQDTLGVIFSAAGLAPGAYADTVLVSASGDSAVSAVSVDLVVLDCATHALPPAGDISDSLTAADCQPPERGGSYARVFALNAAPNDSVSLTVTATGFVPYLSVTDAASAAPIAQGACTALGTPCLRYILLRGIGPFHAAVSATQAALVGPFELQVRSPTPPESVASLAQLRADGSALARGATITDTAVTISATARDPDPGDRVRLEVEVEPAGAAFRQSATARSALLAQGVLTVLVPELTDAGYHWQARVVDETGRASPWVAFGASGPDFVIATPATALAWTGQPGTVTAGAVFSPPLTVAATKPGGQTDTTFTGSISLAVSGAPAGVALGGTTTRAAVRGVATFNDVHLDRAGAGYTIVAAAQGLASDTSAAFSVRSGAAARLAVAAQPGTTVAGASLQPAPTLQALDAFGNIATGYTGQITAALSGGTAGATLSGTAVVSASQGSATFSDLHINRSGSGYQLAFSASGLSGATTDAFSVTPAAAVSMTFAVQPSTTRQGQPITPAVTIHLLDAFGNVATGYTGTVHAAIGQDPNLGLSALAGTVNVAVANGVATFSNLSINLTGNGFTLVMTAGGLPSVESASFDVTF